MHWSIYLLLAPIIFYLLVSFLIYYKGKIPARVNFIQENEADLLARNSERFVRYHQEMLGLGFQTAGAFSADSIDNIHNELLIYHHPDYFAVGMVASIQQTQINEVWEYADFSECFTDGTRLTVGNPQKAPGYPAIPLFYCLQFPEQQMLAELWASQRLISQYFHQTRHSIDLRKKNPIDAINEHIAFEAAALQKRGYVRQANADGECPLTFWGALNMTWRYLPVLSKLLLRYRCRVSRKLLIEAYQNQ